MICFLQDKETQELIHSYIAIRDLDTKSDLVGGRLFGQAQVPLHDSGATQLLHFSLQ